MEPFENISPLDGRYIGPDETMRKRMSPYLSEAASIRYQLKVEVALLETMAEFGICSASVPESARKAAEDITAKEVFEEERRIGHNVRALVNSMRKRMPENERGFVHLFATSNDILDTSRTLAFRDFASEILIPDLIDLVSVISGKAREYASVRQIGRTHGQYAEPITFGYALSLYVSRIGGRTVALERAREDLRGKLSGAVGAHNALALHDPMNPAIFERKHLERLGLKASDTQVSTQVIEPEAMADFVFQGILAMSAMANLADDMRHLIRSEIGEVKIVDGATRVGSSTMPHKVNPVAFENVKSLWKAFAPRIVTVLMDQISEHQRDLTNSASSRFLGEILAAVDYAARRLGGAMKKIQPDEEALGRHLAACRDQIVAEPLYVILALSGHPDGYGKVRSLLKDARESESTLLQAAGKDEEAAKILEGIPPHQAKVIDDPTSYTGDAAERALHTCDEWEKTLGLLR
ncbi:MAG: lyase family protein [Planctomycetota bacterium]|nr:lyase family protein [Planctomycetota bacterium]